MRLLLLLALFLAAPAPAATVTLSNGASCPYSAISINAAGGITVACAATVTPVVPGGGPPAPPPYVPPTQPVPVAGVLSIDGVYVRHTTGHAIYPMPGIAAGREVEVSVSAGFELIVFTIRDPAGNPVRSKWSGMPIDHVRLETGYGNEVFIAPVSGDYSVELDGGGSLTTVNSWRR